MEKIKYYQLAFKDGEWKKLISPSRTEIAALEGDGWTLAGYDSEPGFTNPILDNGEVREMTEAEITAAGQAAETARQAAKSDKLKEAENEFLTLFAGIPSEVGIAPGDNSATIKTKLLAHYSADKTSALEIAVDLLNAIHEVELQGGSWYDLPVVPHILEE
ncbi:MAG: hypothetical protein PHV82_11515 [Victivallaceae bacterium]|nr:hypothetical protein [Victivallaceae bacterium]